MSSEAASGTSTLSVLAALNTSAPSMIPSGLACVWTSITEELLPLLVESRCWPAVSSRWWTTL